MSMNLNFIKDRKLLGFPFQTSTHLTYAVMDESDIERKLAIITAHVRKYRTKHETKEMMNSIRETLNQQGVELTII